MVTLTGVNSSIRPIEVVSMAPQTARIRGAGGNIVQYRLHALYRSHKDIVFDKAKAENMLQQHFKAALTDKLKSAKLLTQKLQSMTCDKEDHQDSGFGCCYCVLAAQLTNMG